MWIIIILIIGLFSPFTFGDNNDILLQEITLPKNLAENKSLRLNCALLQGSSVIFEWYLNNQKLEQNNKRRIVLNEESSELVIKSLSVDDIGDYTCIAKNQFNQNSQNVSLFFNVKPKFTNEFQDLTGTLSKEINLECNAKGYPFPVIEWMKLSENNQKISKKFTSNSIKFDLSKETTGFYRCIARNSLGSIERTVQIKYYGK